MIKPKVPANESERLAALKALHLLDSESEERFDRLARMAKRMFQVPMATFTLVDSDRQWFKSSFGIEAKETPRDISFCGHAINGTETLVIENALNDPRFVDNPSVIGDPHIRFYAGVPVHTRDGYAIGTLCIMDKVPRIFHPEDIGMLEDLARLLESELRAVEMATMDELTRISNRRGFYMVAEHSLSLAYRNRSSAVLALIDLNDFKHINDSWGHAEGDLALQRFASFMKDFFRDSDLVGRIGGDEFAVLMLNTDLAVARTVLAKFEASTQPFNQSSRKPYDIDYSIGLGLFDPTEPRTIHQLVENADREMYLQKKENLAD